MKGTQNTIATTISLTEMQRSELAKSLSIAVQFIPASLGVIGMTKNSASVLGIPDAAKAKFSPALIMM